MIWSTIPFDDSSHDLLLHSINIKETHSTQLSFPVTFNKKNVPYVSLQQAEVNMHLKQLLNEMERPKQLSIKEKDTVITAAVPRYKCWYGADHFPRIYIVLIDDPERCQSHHKW